MKIDPKVWTDVRATICTPTDHSDDLFVNQQVAYKFPEDEALAVLLKLGQFSMLGEFPVQMLPEKEADLHGIGSFALRNVFYFCISNGLVTEMQGNLEERDMQEIQLFMATFATMTLGCSKAVGIELNSTPERGEEHVLFTGSMVLAVEQEVWERMFSIKQKELAWATAWHEQKVAKAKITTEAELTKLGVKIH